LARTHPQSTNLNPPRVCILSRDDFLAADSPGWRMDDIVVVDTHTLESDMIDDCNYLLCRTLKIFYVMMRYVIGFVVSSNCKVDYVTTYSNNNSIMK